jgi:hypothetical protein
LQEAETPAATIEVEEAVAAPVVEEAVAQAQGSELSAEPAAAEPVAEAVVEQDEDKILEALIRDEEEAARQGMEQAEAETSSSFSVEDLESFTLDDVAIGDEDVEAGREDFELLPVMPVLTPDAGKIRFAEDIVDETRGSGRGNRKARRGSAAGPRGARRGGGR